MPPIWSASLFARTSVCTESLPAAFARCPLRPFRLSFESTVLTNCGLTLEPSLLSAAAISVGPALPCDFVLLRINCHLVGLPAARLATFLPPSARDLYHSHDHTK